MSVINVLVFIDKMLLPIMMCYNENIFVVSLSMHENTTYKGSSENAISGLIR